MSSRKQIALITGANKGIGYELAKQMAQQGYTVLLGARNPARGEEAAAALKSQGLDVQFVTIDLESKATLTAAAAVIEEQFGELDVLVNNAAVSGASDGPPSSVNVDDMRRLFETNFFGTVELTQAMLPLLKKAPYANIVNVSSELGSVSLHADWDWKYAPVKFLSYCSSKAALNMMTVQLAYELRETKIKVNAVNPGYTATDLNGNSGTQTVKEAVPQVLKMATLGEDGPTRTYTEKHGDLPW